MRSGPGTGANVAHGLEVGEFDVGVSGYTGRYTIDADRTLNIADVDASATRRVGTTGGMGIEVDREHFSIEEHAAFAEQLENELEQLRELLERPSFGEGDRSIGAEVEMHLADAAGRPACVNHAILAALHDPHCTLETNAFNLEINAPPQPLAGRPFTAYTGRSPPYSRVYEGLRPISMRVSYSPVSCPR